MRKENGGSGEEEKEIHGALSRECSGDDRRGSEDRCRRRVALTVRGASAGGPSPPTCGLVLGEVALLGEEGIGQRPDPASRSPGLTSRSTAPVASRGLAPLPRQSPRPSNPHLRPPRTRARPHPPASLPDRGSLRAPSPPTPTPPVPGRAPSRRLGSAGPFPAVMAPTPGPSPSFSTARGA